MELCEIPNLRRRRKSATPPFQNLALQFNNGVDGHRLKPQGENLFKSLVFGELAFCLVHVSSKQHFILC